MTVSKKCNDEFERIAKQVVEYLLQGANAEITQTRPHKDGGYDILANCIIGEEIHKVYFECKLRSGNLNLRDIAANVIIAFNEGATGLVAMTNYDYTPQLDKHLKKFYDRTVINIKIIIGEEIKSILLKNQVHVSNELISIINKRANNRKEDSTFLRIDFSHDELYKQIIYKSKPESLSGNVYLPNVILEKVQCAQKLILQGHTILVLGYAGVGKSTFIAAVAEKIGCKTILVNAKLYNTQELLLIDILIQIWGIPERFFLEELTEENITKIVSFLGQDRTDPETAQIIFSLLSRSFTGAENNIRYNSLICKYLISLISLRREDLRYLFCIKNLQFANGEIYPLIIYLVKLIEEASIGCMVECLKGEYQLQGNAASLDELYHLPKSHLISVEFFTVKQAIGFLRHEKPDLSNATAQKIVRNVGTRLYNLAMILSYFAERGITDGDPGRIEWEISGLTPNDLPNLVNKRLSPYLKTHRKLFELAVMFRYRIPIELLEEAGMDADNLNELFDEQIFSIEQDYIIPSNSFIRSEIADQTNTSYSQLLRLNLTKKILESTSKEPDRYQDIRIQFLYDLGKYEAALQEIEPYLQRMEKTRQFSELIEFLDIAVSLAEELEKLNLKAEYLLRQLDILVIKKEIAGQKAAQRLEDLSKLLSSQALGAKQKTYQIAYDYLQGKRAFKEGQFNGCHESFAANRQHYQRCIGGIYTDNTGDWLGRTCCNYALFIKETKGNSEALIIFNSALEVLPDSFELQREYYSHVACMNLYGHPHLALDYYEKILQLFKCSETLCALPFHEYGDKAMSMLLAGAYENALEEAEQALTIMNSYGVMDEIGRIANIKGCAMLCIGQLSNAKEQFLEATAIMERSGYRLYSWRSNLNLLQLLIEEGGDQSNLAERLLRLYNDFKELLSAKIRAISAVPESDIVQSREYHALLVFGRCWKLLGINKCETIADDFDLKKMKRVISCHVRALMKQKSKVIKGSPYFSHGRIFLIG